MDEYNQGMDPEVKKLFRKIINSFAVALIWVCGLSALAFMFKMAIVKESWSWQNTVFYILLPVTLGLFLRYMYQLWKKNK